MVNDPVTFLTGHELQAARRKAKISQASMAGLIGCSRHAVSYWETKPMIEHKALRSGVPARMCNALEIPVLPNFCKPASFRASWGLSLDLADGLAVGRSSTRSPCGARTRKGTPCRAKALSGKQRCKFHGGKSTGPRTVEGKARIAEAQRKRWVDYRREAQSKELLSSIKEK